MVRLGELKVRDVMTEDIITASSEDTVSDAIALMKRHDISEIPVLSERKVVGMVSDETFIKKRHMPLSAKLKYVIGTPPTVSEEDSIVDACVMLLSSGYRGIPVISDKGLYTGFISRSDIVRTIPETEDLEGMKVEEIMSPDPSTIQEHETVGDATVLMDSMDERVLPVVDESGRLFGMIGIKDIVKGPALKPPTTETWGERVGEKDRDVENLEVKSLMVEPPITTSPDEAIQEAAKKMAENNISALVALEGEEIKGVITQFDLIEFIASLGEVEQAYVQITGLAEDIDVVYSMHDSIRKYLQLFGRIIKPSVMSIQVIHHRKKGGHETKYGLRLRLQTDKGMFYARNHGWDIMKTLDEALETLRREIIQEKERRIERIKVASRSRETQD